MSISYRSLRTTALVLFMAAALGGCVIASERSSTGNPVTPVTGSENLGVERTVPRANLRRFECVRGEVVTGIELEYEEGTDEVKAVSVVCAPLRVDRRPG